jgi:phosphoribosylformylglycinamidine cyclo-ligase
MEENMEEDFYKHSGVDTKQEESAMTRLLKWINPTFENRKCIGKNLMPIGFFANVLDLGNQLGLAISTDGVGTKILVAEMAKRYDTIGIDCIAMNVNDLLCVGAEPISFVDYIAVGEIRPEQIEQIAKGLYLGALEAGVNIPGGELAQVKEIIHHSPESFDIVGTAIGLVDINKIITGKQIKGGDIIIGLYSNGIHSNGLTLARRLLLKDSKGKEKIIDELLKPTKIYCKEILALKEKISIKGLANITGEGFLNIIRLEADVNYCIDNLPVTPDIFVRIQEEGKIPNTEMYKDFNMGIGFVVIISKNDLPSAESILTKMHSNYCILGKVEEATKPRIELKQKGIYSVGSYFQNVKS